MWSESGSDTPFEIWILWKFSAVTQPFVQSEADAMLRGTVLQSYPRELTARSQPC
jgi:hypothetical protein